jgi:methylated-DNA-protein-cysteine methyltransferase-like protein
MHPYHRIWSIVDSIPRGRVATYGDVARWCRLAGQARFVGYALHGLPPESGIPWHRVINSRGEVSLQGETGQRQRRLLEAEGVVFEGGRVDLETYRWVRHRARRRRQ